MTDKQQRQTHYEEWLTERREVGPSAGLADQIMSQVADLECRRRDVWWLRLVQRIECSQVARWSVYGSALAIGGLPFFFLAYVPSF